MMNTLASTGSPGCGFSISRTELPDESKITSSLSSTQVQERHLPGSHKRRSGEIPSPARGTETKDNDATKHNEPRSRGFMYPPDTPQSLREEAGPNSWIMRGSTPAPRA